MSLLSIKLFSSNILEGEITSVEFDGILAVTPVISNTVTRRPVEDGFDTSDAVHNNPTTVDISIIITDTAQSLLDTRAVSNLANIIGTKFIQSYTKKQLVRLQKISDNRELVNIKTKYNIFEDYFLENFTYTETPDDALEISFTIVENRTDVVETSSNISDSVGVFS